MAAPVRVEGFRSSLAILIGIDQYGDGVPVLRTPVHDATKLASILQRDHGFETEVLVNENATIEKLRRVFADLSVRIGADDRVLFYFAGHGIALESDEGPKGYLLPQDAKRNSTDRYLSMVELNEALSVLPCRHMLIVLDCCFAGAFRWSSTRDLVLAPENLSRERYSWFVRDAAWQAIASAAHDQKALDVAAGEALGERGQNEGHSPFAKALMDGLLGKADRLRADGTADGVITATELLLHLEEQLMPLPGSGRPRQTPILWPLAKHDKGQFIFLAPGKAPDLPPAPPLDPEANPWRGLKVYDRAHANLYFGRRRASELLLARVLKDPLVVVTGPSGIGKSSLVRAGLLPRLPNSIRPIVARLGSAPFDSLASSLAQGDWSEESPSAERLKADPKALGDWIEKQRPGCPQILLVIDQAEELITQNGDAETISAFLDQIERTLARTSGPSSQPNATSETDALALLEALGYASVTGLRRDDGGGWRAAAMQEAKPVEAKLEFNEFPLRVVFTVRSEFDSQFAQSPLKDRWLVSRYFVPPMTQDELRRVIEGPAAVQVMRFETNELIEKLVNEVVQMPGALPLLSFALSEMYAAYLRRPKGDRMLAYKHYEELEGGVTGSLRVRANQIIDDMDDLQRLTARRVLERLVAVESGEFARRRVARQELEAPDPAENARVSEVLRRLDDARLIVTDGVENERHLELAHDALIFGWDRLHAWVREDAASIGALRLVTADATRWDRSYARQPKLLWSDPARLESIHKLRSDPFPGLNKTEAQFADESIRNARRLSFVRRAAILSLIALTLSSIGASIYAFVQQTRAEARLREAQANESNTLVAQSRMLLSRGDAVTAAITALRALPDPLSPNRPIVPSAAGALIEALTARTEQFVVVPDAFAKGEVFVSVQMDESGSVVYGVTNAGNLVQVDVASQKSTILARGLAEDISTAIIGPKGNRVVAVSNDGRVVTWSRKSNAVTKLPIHRDPGGRLFALLDTVPERIVLVPEGALKGEPSLLFDAETGGLVAKLQDAFGMMSFARRGGTVVLTANSRGGNRSWNALNGEVSPELPSALKFPMGLVPAFDSEVYLGHEGAIVSLMEGSISGDVQTRYSYEAAADARLTVSANGMWVAELVNNLNRNDVQIRFIGKYAKDEVRLSLPWGIREVSLSYSGLQLAGRTGDGRIAVWAPEARVWWSPLFSARFNAGQSSAALLPATGSVASTGYRLRVGSRPGIGGVLNVWDRRTFNSKFELQTPPSDLLHNLVADPLGQNLYAVGEQGRIWRFELGSETVSEFGHGDIPDASSIAFTPGGAELIVGGDQGQVGMFSSNGGTAGGLLKSLSQKPIISLVARTHHGERVIAAAMEDESSVQVWLSGQSEPDVLPSKSKVTSLGLTDSLLAIGDIDGGVTLRDLDNLKSARTINGARSEVSAIAFDGPGQRIATGAADGTVRLFDVASGELQLEFQATPRRFLSMQFSPEGDVLMTAGEDHATRLWPIHKSVADLIRTATAALPKPGDRK